MKNLLSFLLLFVMFTGCTLQNNRENDSLSNIRQLFPHLPDSALPYLEKSGDNIITNEDEATLELIEYYINDLTQYGNPKDSFPIQRMHKPDHYPNNFDHALSSYYAGVFLMNNYEYEKAIELFHASEQIANNMKWDHLLGMIYYKSSEIFYELNLYNTSIEYADKSIHHFNLAGDNRLANRSLAYKIFSLFELNAEDDARELYQTTKKYALAIEDIEYLKFIAWEIISIKLFDDKVDRAENYYRDMVKYNSGSPLLPIESLYLGYKYTIENQLDSAYYYLSMVKEDSLTNEDRILLTYFYSEFYRKKGDYKKALEFIDENLSLWDTELQYKERSSLVKYENRFQNLKTRFLYEKEVLVRERIVYWILIFFFLLIIFTLTYYYRVKKQKEEMRNRIAIISEVVSRLKDSNQTLLSKLDTQKEKENQLKEQIESKLEYAKLFAELYSKFQHKPTLFLKKMDELIDLMPANKEFTTVIINMVNLHYNNAIEKLTTKHTDLTSAEILFSALIIANFSVHEMALILNCNSVDAIYTRKYRLKQKLVVDKSMSIEDYLSIFAVK